MTTANNVTADNNVTAVNDITTINNLTTINDKREPSPIQNTNPICANTINVYPLPTCPTGNKFQIAEPRKHYKSARRSPLKEAAHPTLSTQLLNFQEALQKVVAENHFFCEAVESIAAQRHFSISSETYFGLSLNAEKLQQSQKKLLQSLSEIQHQLQ